MRESDAIHCGLRVVRSKRRSKECADCGCYISVFSRAVLCDYCKQRRARLAGAARMKRWYHASPFKKGGALHEENLRRQRMRYRNRNPLPLCRDCGVQVSRKNSHRCIGCNQKHRRILGTARMRRYLRRRRMQTAGE